MSSLDDLMLLMRRLRDADSGCPWDRRQNMRSLLPYTLEEVYELVDTIERDDMPHLKEELGDYLFQAAFYAQLAEERGLFDLQDVVSDLVIKLVERHPHVFPDGRLDGGRASSEDMNEAQIRSNWERHKREKRAQRQQHGVLDDVPRALPALQRAQKLQKRAAGVGFDWRDHHGVQDKLGEELLELDAALRCGQQEAIAHELGDLLFSLVNLVRHLSMDAEQVLSAANRRFEQRFAYLEQRAQEVDRELAGMSLEEMERLWQEAKH